MYDQTLADNDKTWAEFSTLEEAGARKITGENLKPVWAEFSTLS